MERDTGGNVNISTYIPPRNKASDECFGMSAAIQKKSEQFRPPCTEQLNMTNSLVI